MGRDYIAKEEVRFVRNVRAKRYIVRVDSQGEIVLTLPRRGTEKFALEVANQHRDWVRQRQILIEQEKEGRVEGFVFGDIILFRGEEVALTLSKEGGRPILNVGPEQVFIADEGMDLRRPLRAFLMTLAKEEFPCLVRAFAAQFEVRVNRVTIRDQKTRWGSCSTSGTISLNWRLILAPPRVLEYVIIHELMHIHEMNHSHRFWKLVEFSCPDFQEHKKWLVDHQDRLSW